MTIQNLVNPFAIRVENIGQSHTHLFCLDAFKQIIRIDGLIKSAELHSSFS